jgi:hypothetical protein
MQPNLLCAVLAGVGVGLLLQKICSGSSSSSGSGTNGNGTSGSGSSGTSSSGGSSSSSSSSCAVRRVVNGYTACAAVCVGLCVLVGGR